MQAETLDKIYFGRERSNNLNMNYNKGLNSYWHMITNIFASWADCYPNAHLTQITKPTVVRSTRVFINIFTTITSAEPLKRIWAVGCGTQELLANRERKLLFYFLVKFIYVIFSLYLWFVGYGKWPLLLSLYNFWTCNFLTTIRLLNRYNFIFWKVKWITYRSEHFWNLSINYMSPLGHVLSC